MRDLDRAGGAEMRNLVIGARSAGAVIAARLSEDPEHDVVLVEAGPDYPDLNSLPFDLSKASVSLTDHDWGWMAIGPTGGPISQPRGKVVGGCSSVNVCIALRGEADDYDNWARHDGPAWSWSQVEPVFRRLEDDPIGGPHHGEGGPVPIRRTNAGQWQPLIAAVYEALTSCGYSPVADHNTPGTSGVGPWPMNRVDGIRQSTAICYLGPARHRPNLRIRSQCEVRRLVFDDLVAVGAELASVAGSEIIEADRIWLCAGAIGSPVVLLRSGIGPKADLAAAGIDCVADVSGVGQGLVDHPAISIVSRTRAEIEHLDTVMMEVGVRYSSGHAQGSFNDMQLTPGAIRNLPGWPDVFAVMTGVYAPLSVGHVSLDPARPWGTPIICPNFLSEPADLERAMDGLRRAWQVLHTAPLAAAVEEVFELTDEEICNDQALASYAQRRCASFHHPVGTARMGPADDPASVVNHTGRVRYTEGLHVVDASIMPTIPRANTNIPTIMLAEHVIDLVRDE